MPTYVFQCPECDQQFEIFAKMSDRRRSRKCPTCGARATRKITGGAGFLFKGEGFYITDYRSEEYRSKEKAEKEKPTEASASEPSSAKAASGAANTDAGRSGEKPAGREAEDAPRSAGKTDRKAGAKDRPPRKDRPRGRRPSSEG